MSSREPTSALESLAVLYPMVAKSEVASVLGQAEQTARRLSGQDDPELAVDLARLRLDVRTHRVAARSGQRDTDMTER